MFNEYDRRQLAKLGVKESLALQQITNFKNGFPYTKLLKPATIGDGLIKLTDDEAKRMAAFYDVSSSKLNILKFVPASGAATRMFKDLYSFWNELEKGNSLDDLFIKFPEAKTFFENLEKFPFYEDLLQASINPLNTQNDKKWYSFILEYFLENKGLNYGSLPKGLLKFHRYDQKTRTSMEEHWIEGASYARNPSGVVRLHFTISPNHEEKFKELLGKNKEEYESALGITLDISYSFQKSSTDVIAVDMENEPFREHDGSLVFRPGGHGALLENLNDCNNDLIFIKNIDNVAPDRLKAETVLYKKALAGVILSYRDKIFQYIRRLESDGNRKLVDEIVDFIENELHYFSREDSHLYSKENLISILNRPIRACGMVKNQGEPGGGPFWTIDQNGNTSLQIVESSQVNIDDPEQRDCFAKSTHFNPVDLICLVKNYKGEKFNLTDFRDPETGFITVKSKDGKPLKAQELPGLWNGAMANWITFFIEVPLVTFNPVKTVNDLLRSNHS
jgi:hypothetical protein